MSTLPPECEQLLISGYVLGNLSPAEALLFQEMLAENPVLIEQVTAMQETLDLVYAPAEVTPPAALRERILTVVNSPAASAESAADAETATEPVAASDLDSTATRSKFPWNKILGAIALAIITALGIANYRLWQSTQTATTTDIQSEPQTYLLQDPDSAQESTAKLVVDPNRLDATLIAEDLPPLPPEKVYALWTVVGKDVPYTTDEKGAILTAVFQVDEAGNFTREIAVPQPHLEPKTVKKIAITVEDISAPQAHTGSIFISTQ